MDTHADPHTRINGKQLEEKVFNQFGQLLYIPNSIISLEAINHLSGRNLERKSAPPWKEVGGVIV